MGNQEKKPLLEVCAYGGALCDSPYEPMVKKRCRWCPFDDNGEKREVPRTENVR